MSNNEEDIPQVEDKVIRISKRASRRLAKRVDELDELLDDTGYQVTNDAGQRGVSGDVLDHATGERYPRIRSLKLVSIRHDVNTAQLAVSNFTIPTKTVPLLNQYTNSMKPQLPTQSYKELSKEHRLKDSQLLDTMHHIATRNTATHPNMDITRLVKNAYAMLTQPMTKKLVFSDVRCAPL